jgi:hypothetical protein
VSAVVLVTLALALLLAWAAAGALSLLGRAVPRLHARSARASTRSYAAVVLAPAALAVLLLLVVLLPTPLAHCHCFEHGSDHPHLCIHHPWLASPLVGFAAPIAGAWFAFALWRVARVARDLMKMAAWARRLRALPAERVDGVEVRFVDGLELGAFTVGLWRPLVVLDRALWRRLESAERSAILHHERAHAIRGDALTQACLRFVCALLPWPTNGVWLRDWRLATEMACDRHAALTLSDAPAVAQALVSVERLRTASLVPMRASPALGVAAGGDLSLRVHALLDEPGETRPALSSDLLTPALAFVALAALSLLWPGGFLHHAAESLLGLLTHHH